MSSSESEKKAPKKQGVGRGSAPGRRTAQPPSAATEGEGEEKKSSLRSLGRRGPVGAKTPTASHAQRMSPPESGSPGQEEKMARKIKLLQLTQRKNQGNLGQEYRMLTNHFEIRFRKSEKGFVVHQYTVNISHERIIKLTVDENRYVFWQCVRSSEHVFDRESAYQCAYDGSKQMFSMKELKFPNKSGTFVFEVSQQLPRDDKTLKFKCVLNYVGPVRVDVDTVGITPQAEITIAPIQILDIIFRQYRSNPIAGMERTFYSFKRNVYKIPERTGDDLGNGREIWNGIYHAVHVCENNKLFLNVDMKLGAFYRQKPQHVRRDNDDYDAIDYMIDVLNTNEGRVLYKRDQLSQMRSPFLRNSKEFVALTKEFKGIWIRSTHLPGSNQRRRVRELSGSPNEEKFKNREDQELSVFNYFKDTHKKQVCPHLPTLSVGTAQRKMLLPMDVCIIDKKQHYGKKLDEKATSNMIRVATKDGALGRYNKTIDLFGKAEFRNDPYLQNFELEVNQQMEKVIGRVLPLPTMLQRHRVQNGGRRTEVNKGQLKPAKLDYQNSFRFEDAAFANASIIKNVGVVFCCRETEDEGCRRFMRDQLRALDELGCGVPTQSDIVVHTTAFQPNTVKRALEVIEQQMRDAGKPLVDDGVICGIVFVLVPQKNTAVYSAIKQTADVELGIMTQVVQFKTFEKRATINIALKVNLKMRGLNAVMEPNEMGKKYYYSERTLLVGIDVTHPSPFDKKSPSIAAIVSNVDSARESFQFGASIKIQKTNRETIVYLNDAIKQRLMKYFTNTKEKPTRILVYRDGVSEGQFSQVLTEEIRGIREACLSLDTNYRPKITYIVVTKRHNTRLYPDGDKEQCGKSKNVIPGVVLDKTIVSNDLFDFYLCSHYGIQGTSRPAKYTVLYDDNDFDADTIQLITYYTTFMYQRASRSVSIPAPVYYADLACTRARLHLTSLLGPECETASEEGAGSSVPEEDLFRQTLVNETLRERMYFV